jgi:hypothetical protein
LAWDNIGGNLFLYTSDIEAERRDLGDLGRVFLVNNLFEVSRFYRYRREAMAFNEVLGNRSIA